MDKVVHFAMFFILSFLLVRMIQVRRDRAGRFQMACVLAFCLGYGGILEYLQSTQLFLRDSDIWDWCADVAGTMVGCICAARRMFPLVFLHQVRKSS